ncbi:unnamed protein product [Amoebophrya sp. A120]|nr:unnamed protein product [Amoebophrya sp. A120]|eukprot:GSA120T00010706001.1
MNTTSEQQDQAKKRFREALARERALNPNMDETELTARTFHRLKALNAATMSTTSTGGNMPGGPALLDPNEDSPMPPAEDATSSATPTSGGVVAGGAAVLGGTATAAASSGRFQPVARSLGTTSHGAGGPADAENIRQKRLEMLEAKQREKSQQLAATKVESGNFKKRDWEHNTAGRSSASQNQEGQAKLGPNKLTVDELLALSTEDAEMEDVETRTVLKHGVLVKERATASVGSTPAAAAAGGAQPSSFVSSTGGALAATGQEGGGALAAEQLVPGSGSPTAGNQPIPSVNKSPGGGGTPAAAAGAQSQSQRPTAHIAPDLLEDLARRVSSGEHVDASKISDMLVGAAMKIRDLEEEKTQLQIGYVKAHSQNFHNLQVLATIDHVLAKTQGLEEREPVFSSTASALQRASQNAASGEQDTAPKSYLIKRGDATHPVNNPLGGAAAGETGIPRGTSGEYTSGGAGGQHQQQPTGGAGQQQARITWSTAGGTTGGSSGSGTALGAAPSEAEMQRQKDARLARLEKQQADAKKEREEAERRAKARDAMGGGGGPYHGGGAASHHGHHR